jgi:transposase
MTPPRRLVFPGESGVRTDLTRTRARGPKGERAWDAVPHGRWRTATAIAAVTLDGPVAPFASEGPADADAFRTYVEKVLAPELRRGDVVVMDDLDVHKAAGVAEAIRRRRARAVYLPPYSPDPNPVELLWAKVRRLLRSAAARSTEAIHRALGDALAAAEGDCLNWFRAT